VSLLALEQRDRRIDYLRSALSLIVYPIQNLVDLSTQLTGGVFENLSSYRQLFEENAELKQEMLIYKTKQLKFEALEKENIRLHALLENSFKLGEQVLVAEIVSVNLAPYEQVVLVNKGSRFGIHAQQPVLDANGVVGQVIRSNPLTAEIMLITDPSHAIPVQVNRNGLRTIAFGSGRPDRLNLPFLTNNADIRPGDLLISSGLGGTFPQGYPVAVVETVEPQADKPFATIYAKPKASLDTSREVLIVWSNSTPVPLTPPATFGTGAPETSTPRPETAKNHDAE
jgi:rod shape-determining protein MreC